MYIKGQEQETIWVNGNPVQIPAGHFPEHSEPRTLVRFVGPILPQWRKDLSKAKIRVEFWCPPLGACLTLPRSISSQQLNARFSFLAGARAYEEALCQRFDPKYGAKITAPLLPSTLVDIICFSQTHRKKVAARLAQMEIPVLAAASSKLRVNFTGGTAMLRNLPGVKLVDRARLPTLLSATEIGAALAGPTTIDDVSTSAPLLDGQDEVIAVADTGLDRGVNDNTLHPDFRGRVKWLVSLPVNESWLPFATPRSDDAADRSTGHGTHVAGLALGSGAGSHGLHKGLAPAATLVFQALEQEVDVKPEYLPTISSGYYLAGRPLDLRELFSAARDEGARIHVNSWGDPAQGAYTDDCYETDLFLRKNPDALILFAAGNDGTDRDGNQVLDSSTLYAPATAKNVVAIGATEGPLSGAGSRATWGDLDPKVVRWRAISDRNDPISGEPGRIAPFSSCGPTRDGRIKPDLCAPGTNLPAPRSQASSFSSWGLANPLPLYMYDGGTSMATGLAGGAAALVRQAWRLHKQTPTGAGLKALLILGAISIAARAKGRRASSMEAGFGLLQISRSLPGATVTVDGTRKVYLKEIRRRGLHTGQLRDYPLTIKEGALLRAVLCWYDMPGERLINDLNLTLIRPDGSQQYGNATGGTAIQADSCNPVEVIDTEPLQAGRHILRISGFNVPEGPQPFALAYAITQPAKR